jgi:ssDNA-binding Zn-finger/Zn-ribbon topoisomerase 1
MRDEIIKCPCCDSEACLYGELQRCDSEYPNVYSFFPSHIKMATFWTLSSPHIRLEKSSVFYGCPDCGHLWSKLRVKQYKKLLERCEWKGGKQVEPPPTKPYIMWFLSLVIAILLASILFFKFYL